MLKKKLLSFLAGILSLFFLVSVPAQDHQGPRVTENLLLNPDPSDWLMYSRTYDNQRFSPLDQVNRHNVDRLRVVWARGMLPGAQQLIPLVYNGVMYVAHPGAVLQALDATNGDVIWEYRWRLPRDIGDYISPERIIGRVRTLAIYGDKLFYASPDGYILALDTDTGELHWETRAHDYKRGVQHTTGPMVAAGKVYSGRNCPAGPDTRDTCFIAAHDAETGEEVWRFTVPAAPGEPGGDTWGGKPASGRVCAPWGLPGGYNPDENLIYWGVANSNPHTRYRRHDGNPFAVPLTAPAELYCNSTLAFNADTGELAWYYQHVPGDDWDSDWTHERIHFRSAFDPDPDAVRWINPDIPRGQEREMIAGVGEGGGLWVLDAVSGDFLWAMPFPYDTPLFHIADIDVETGRTIISRDTVLTRDGEKHTLCFSNIRGYWPMAYHPGENALYIAYHDTCDLRVGNLDNGNSNGHNREAMLRPGGDPDALAGIAKVDMETGRIARFHTQRYPSNGAVLATAGGLIFWGDMNRRLRAFDAVSGDILWEAIVGGNIQNSTITYSVDGRQYIAVLTGDGVSHTTSKQRLVPDLVPARGHNAIYVFALPE